jgi:hypothetical protein
LLPNQLQLTSNLIQNHDESAFKGAGLPGLEGSNHGFQHLEPSTSWCPPIAQNENFHVKPSAPTSVLNIIFYFIFGTPLPLFVTILLFIVGILVCFCYFSSSLVLFKYVFVVHPT